MRIPLFFLLWITTRPVHALDVKIEGFAGDISLYVKLELKRGKFCALVASN